MSVRLVPFMVTCPEELLQTIVECIAHDTVAFQSPTFHWKYEKTGLLALSCVNHQFRRLCLPFLFAHIDIRNPQLQNLIDICIANENLAECVRALDVAPQVPNSRSLSHFPTSAMSDIIPRLRKLRQINLRNISPGGRLLTVLNSSPISTVFIDPDLAYKSFFVTPAPPYLYEQDLAKVICIRDVALDVSNLDNIVAIGMQVRHLHVHLKHLDTRIIPGLCELTLNEPSDNITLEWLSNYARLHPLLKNVNVPLRFNIGAKFLVDHFVQNSQTMAFLLDAAKYIQQFTIARAGQTDSESGGPVVEHESKWYIAKLSIMYFTQWSSGAFLLTLCHHFPQISKLSLHIPDQDCVDFDELVDSLSRFSSIEVLDLICRFNFTALGSYPITNATIIAYTSRIAQRVPTIEAFFIDVGHKDRCFKGQLEVRNLGVEGRHTAITSTGR